MSNCVPHYTKKRQALVRKEQRLRRLIGRQANAENILAAAGDVLESRIRVLKAERATIAPSADGPGADRLVRIDEKIRVLAQTPIAEVLAEFGFPPPERETDQ